MASPMNTSAPTLARLASSRAWASTRSICVDPPRTSMRLMSCASPCPPETKFEARHSSKPAEIDKLHVEAAEPGSASNIFACSDWARSQVGCRLMVASSAKISRPRPEAPGAGVFFAASTKAAIDSPPPRFVSALFLSLSIAGVTSLCSLIKFGRRRAVTRPTAAAFSPLAGRRPGRGAGPLFAANRRAGRPESRQYLR